MPQLVSYQEKEQTLEVRCLVLENEGPEVLQQQLLYRSWRGSGGERLLKLQCLKDVIWAEEIARLGPEFDSPERGEGGEGHTKDRDIIVMYFCIAFATETGRPVRLSGYPE